VNKRSSTWLLLIIGLNTLAFVMPWWLSVNATALSLPWALLLGAVTPLLLVWAVVTRKRNWSGITALIMIPYSVIGVMEIVATLGEINLGMAIGVLGIANFFLALDAGRRCA
jgi:hypothetical protein